MLKSDFLLIGAVAIADKGPMNLKKFGKALLLIE